MTIRSGKKTAGLLLLILLLAGAGTASGSKTGQQELCDQIYRFRAMETLYHSRAPELTRSESSSSSTEEKVAP